MKFRFKFLTLLVCCLLLLSPVLNIQKTAFADTNKTYYTVYDESKKNIILLKGGEVCDGDKYLSSDNKLYVISGVDEKNKTAVAKFLNEEKLPEFNVSAKQKTAARELLSYINTRGACGELADTRRACALLR